MKKLVVIAIGGLAFAAALLVVGRIVVANLSEQPMRPLTAEEQKRHAACKELFARKEAAEEIDRAAEAKDPA